MSEGRRRVYCTQCGSIVRAEDIFCGTCGTRIASDAPDAAPTGQIPTLVQPPSNASTRGGGRTLAVVAGLGAVALLVLIGGVVFATSLLSGGSEEAPEQVAAPPSPTTLAEAPPETPEETMQSEPAPADNPEGLVVGDSAEVGGVRATLNGVRTLPVTDFDQPISGADNLFVAADMTFENASDEPVSVSSLLEIVLKDESGYSASQTIHSEQRQLSEGNIAPGQRSSGEIVYEVSPDTGDVQLDYTPFAGLETFTWSIGDLGSVPGATSGSEQESTPQEQPIATTEASVDSFVSSYYAAVGQEDWQATYSLLDSESQASFTEEEWIERQVARNAGAAPAPLVSAVVNSVSGQATDQSANITLYYEDGTQETLDIVVSSEDSAYKRHLTDDEIAFLQSL